MAPPAAISSAETRTWDRARRARDPRFDGRFFIAVRTTRIYCRPICPAPSPKPQNITYYRTAAAAAEAGYRPCLRCRPEASPGTPAWAGTPSSIRRALKLISESALDDAGVDQLAGRLGIGSRHLRRLFGEHLGATPVAVAQTRRVHFAKKLIDETDLAMTRIALAAGFGSVRRFNATFQNLYGRSPSELRRSSRRVGRPSPLPDLAKQKSGVTLATLGSRVPNGEFAPPADLAGCYRFKLAYRPPYDWNAMIAFLAARAIPGVETVSATEYRRTIAIDGKTGAVTVRHSTGPGAGARNSIEAEIRFPDPAALLRITERVRRIFDLSADPASIEVVLKLDEQLAPMIRRWPGMRVAGCWEGFEMAVRAILGQQISVKGASTLAGRLASAFGRSTEGGLVFPSAEILAEADLSRIGLTGARIRTIRSLASGVANGEISLDWALDHQEVEEMLIKVPGIGPWTAQYIAMRLGEPDAFPAADLYLKPYAGRSDPWRPWRAYAAMYIWRNAKAEKVETNEVTK